VAVPETAGYEKGAGFFTGRDAIVTRGRPRDEDAGNVTVPRVFFMRPGNAVGLCHL
jgi:hypothetical protein